MCVWSATNELRCVTFGLHWTSGTETSATVVCRERSSSAHRCGPGRAYERGMSAPKSCAQQAAVGAQASGSRADHPIQRIERQNELTTVVPSSGCNQRTRLAAWYAGSLPAPRPGKDRRSLCRPCLERGGNAARVPAQSGTEEAGGDSESLVFACGPVRSSACAGRGPRRADRRVKRISDCFFY